MEPPSLLRKVEKLTLRADEDRFDQKTMKAAEMAKAQAEEFDRNFSERQEEEQGYGYCRVAKEWQGPIESRAIFEGLVEDEIGSNRRAEAFEKPVAKIDSSATHPTGRVSMPKDETLSKRETKAGKNLWNDEDLIQF
jgi:hypothetical protein